MAEPEKFVLSHKELAETLIKRQGIHEGIWGLYVEFGLAAPNAKTQDGMMPTALVPIQKLGLQRFEEENDISVDASRVNPKRKIAPRRRTKKGS